MVARPRRGSYDAVVLAVAHDQFKAMGEAKIRALGKKADVLYDMKVPVARGAE